MNEFSTNYIFKEDIIMYNKIIESIQEQTEKFSAPIRKIGELSVEGVERLAQLHTETIRSYTDLSIEQIKKALSTKITDTESLQTFITEQTESIHTVGLKVTDDIKAYVALGEDLGEEMKKIAKENSDVFSGNPKV